MLGNLLPDQERLAPKPEKPDADREALRRFRHVPVELEQAIFAVAAFRVHHEWISLPATKAKSWSPRSGRAIFNPDSCPRRLVSVNETHDEEADRQVTIGDVYRKTGNNSTVEFLDKLKATGFPLGHSKSGNFPWVLGDMLIPEGQVERIIDEGPEEGRQPSRPVRQRCHHRRRALQPGDRYLVARDVRSGEHPVRQARQGPDAASTPIYMMADSGARGSREQIKQLSGMRGLMQEARRRS